MKTKRKKDMAAWQNTLDGMASLYRELSAKCTQLEGTLGDIRNHLQQLERAASGTVKRVTALEHSLNEVANESLMHDYFYGGDADE